MLNGECNTLVLRDLQRIHELRKSLYNWNSLVYVLWKEDTKRIEIKDIQLHKFDSGHVRFESLYGDSGDQQNFAEIFPTVHRFSEHAVQISRLSWSFLYTNFSMISVRSPYSWQNIQNADVRLVVIRVTKPRWNRWPLHFQQWKSVLASRIWVQQTIRLGRCTGRNWYDQIPFSDRCTWESLLLLRRMVTRMIFRSWNRQPDA